MATLNYINFPNVPISNISWGMQGLGAVFTSPGGVTQGVDRTSIWKAQVSITGIDDNDSIRALSSFFAQCSRPNTVFYLSDTSYTARGTLNGSPTVSGGGQSGFSLTTAGWSAGANNVLRDGDYIQIASGQMFSVVGDVNANASGVATINLATGIRKAPASGSVVTVSNPKVTMWIPKMGVQGAFSPPVIGDFTFECVERIV